MAKGIDNLINAVGGGIGAALTSDPKDTSNAAKSKAATSAAETDVEVEDIEAQGNLARATGGATGPMPTDGGTGEIVPYSQEDAAGNPNIAMALKQTDAETVDGIRTGEPATLEKFYITQDDRGRSIVKFRDDSGQEQQWVVSAAQALALMDTRRENRHKMAQYNAQQLELQQAREENQGAFERGLNMLDDGTNPMLSGYLKDRYNDNPIGTLKWMYDLHYLEAKDADAAAAVKYQFVNGAMYKQSNQTFQRFGQTLDRHFGNQTLEYQRLLYKDKNNPQIKGALEQHETNMSVFRKGIGFKPHPGMDMSKSPGQAYTNPARRVDMYRTWMEMLSIGVPTATGQHRYTVNNPQDPEAWESERENQVMHLEWLSRQLGWQGSFIDPNTGMLNIEDEAAIRKAYHQIYNNPSVLMANQQSNPALSSQGIQYQGSTQQGLPGGVPWAPGQAPPQQGLTPLQQVPLPTGTPGAQQLTPQQQPPPQSQIDLDRVAAPFGDPLDLQIASDTRAVEATEKAALDKARADRLEQMRVLEQIQLLSNNMSPAQLEADKLIQELHIENEKMLLAKLESMQAIYDGLEPGDEREFLLAVMKVLAEEATPESFEKARKAIKAAEEDKDK